MKFFLIVAKGKKAGLPIPIEIDLFLIGSGEECQLRAVHDDIGEQHCAIVTRDRKVFVSDLGSGHHTLVNGEPIEPGQEWPLHSKDMLEVGPLKFMIQYREKALSQRDMEEWALSCLDQNQERKAEFSRRASEEFHSEEFEKASSAAAAILDGLNAQRGVVVGRLRISRDGSITVVRINDVYLVEDAELAMLKRELQENLKGANLRVLIDMKHVRRMSSQAAVMFGEVRRWVGRAGGRMAVCRLRPDFHTVMAAHPGTHDIPIFDEKPKALAGKW
ncbi:MAG TPA: FHA domain-containing protein [Gemmataceae bacterium]|jgi:anti-anti-sigma regulatory factor|nr:FHA domain-containing protein [Gemmataceae bacterium]